MFALQSEVARRVDERRQVLHRMPQSSSPPLQCAVEAFKVARVQASQSPLHQQSVRSALADSGQHEQLKRCARLRVHASLQSKQNWLKLRQITSKICSILHVGCDRELKTADEFAVSAPRTGN